MKTFSLLSCLLILAVCSAAQSAAQDSLKIGTQTIVIPPPSGFVNAYSRIPAIKSHFDANPDKEGKTLAVYIPSSVALKIEKGEMIGSLDFYATVDSMNSVADVEVTPQMFAEFRAEVEKTIGAELDPKGKTVTTAVANMRRALTEQTGQPSNFDIQQPINLGFFDKQPKILSVMILATLRVGDRTMPMVGARSWIVINKRIVYINIYKLLTGDNDVSIVLDFTKQWTASILAANDHN